MTEDIIIANPSTRLDFKRAGILLSLIERPIVGTIIGVEIGVWKGAFANALLSSSQKLFLIGVDPYLPFDETQVRKRERKALKNMDALWQKTDMTLSAWGERWLLKRSTSDAAALVFPDRSADFVYIDGNHSYENVLCDIRNWERKVVPGGILSGHDFGTVHAGVEKAVTEFAIEKGRDLHVNPEFGIWMWWWKVPEGTV